jgi:hypothetical protein
MKSLRCLKREVAILPEEFSRDADRIER